MSALCGVLCISVLIASVRGNITAWQTKPWLPKGITSVNKTIYFKYANKIKVNHIISFVYDI